MTGEQSDIIARLMPGQGDTSEEVSRDAPVSHGLVGAEISVPPAVLRSAAGEAQVIAEALKGPTATAMRDGHDAASALRGWELGGKLGVGMTEWTTAYRSLMRRVELTGTLIGDAANGFVWSDEAISATFPADVHPDPKTIGKAVE
jgi:hypothetical protein